MSARALQRHAAAGERLRDLLAIASDQHDGARARRHRRLRAARSPGPCRRRRRSAPPSAACRSAPRRWRRRWCPWNRRRSARRRSPPPSARDAASPSNSRSACSSGCIRQVDRARASASAASALAALCSPATRSCDTRHAVSASPCASQVSPSTLDQAPFALAARRVQAEGEYGRGRRSAMPRAPRILAIEHLHAVAAEDARLGVRVGVHAVDSDRDGLRSG